MENWGKVSVIMPSYNTCKFIAASIRSVQDQTYPDWELIIVDDCSSDNTDDVVAPFLEDKRILYLKNKKNSGAANSRNYALRVATGRWIAFLDSDDLWSPEKLFRQLSFMAETGSKFSYTNYVEIDENGNAMGYEISGPRKITKTGMYCYCWPGCLTVMFDKECLGTVQVPDIKKNNDYAMWLELCVRAECLLLPETLAYYRRRCGSISNHSYMYLLTWHYKLWHDAQKKNLFFAVFMTIVNAGFGFLKKFIYRKRKRRSL